jgi:sulfite exporter TauE/SafE
MLAFGLGTLPNLVLMGVGAAQLNRWVRRPMVRHVAGALVIAFGVMLVADAWHR